MITLVKRFGTILVSLWALSSGVPSASAQVREALEPPTIPQYTGLFGLGTEPDPTLIATMDIDVMTDGQGLPRGSGTALGGKFVYNEHCAQCHGTDLQGIDGIRGGALIGGRGSLVSATPLKTVESYWPFATTVIDYVGRAMPFDQPRSLGTNDLYAVVAFVLYRARIIRLDEIMNSSTLQLVQMPNRTGFTNNQGIIETFNWR